MKTQPFLPFLSPWYIYRAGILFLLLFFSYSLWSHYSVRAFSDPLNWLNFARHFSHQFFESKWPLGYPIFLAGVLHLVGPIRVFLANLPLLVLMIWLVGAYARKAFADSDPYSLLAQMLTMCLLFVLNHDMLTYLTNPYRDPLSYILLAGAGWVLLRYIEMKREGLWIWLLLAGVCTGLAYCVREPSLLIVPVFVLAGLSAIRQGVAHSFWISALYFTGGLLLGASPFLAQSLLATGNPFVPVQSAQESRLVPGMYLTQLAVLLPMAANFYIEKYSLWGLLFAFLGILRLGIHRKWPLLILLCGATLTYFIFYSFYYTFVARYFFVTDLFCVPLIGIGATWVLASLLSLLRTKPPRLIPGIQVSLVILLGAWVFVTTPRPIKNLFKISDAQAFSNQLNQHIPASSIVLCDRNLCEIISWFSSAESFPVEAMAEEPDLLDIRFATKSIRKKLEEGKSIYVVKPLSAKQSKFNIQAATSGHDSRLVWSFQASDFHLEHILGRTQIEIYQILPFSSKTVVTTLPRPSSKVLGICLDERELWNDASRTYAKLYVNDHLLSESIQDGPNLFSFPPHLDGSSPLEFKIESDAPLSTSPYIKLIEDGRPVRWSFGLESIPSDTPFLGSGFAEEPAAGRWCRSMRETGTVKLPVFCCDDHWLYAYVSYRMGIKSPSSPPAKVRLCLPGGGESFNTSSYNREEHILSGLIECDHLESNLWAKVDITVIPPQNDTDPKWKYLELSHILLVPIPRKQEYQVELAAGMGMPFRGKGFYSSEANQSGETVMWAKDICTFRVWLAPSDRTILLCFTGYDHRPVGAPPANPTCLFQGQALPLVFEHGSDRKFRIILDVPPRQAVYGENEVEFKVAGWQPSAFGVGKDKRTLGLQWHALEVSATEAR